MNRPPLRLPRWEARRHRKTRPAGRTPTRRLRVVVTLTFAGDLSTVLAAVGVVMNTPVPMLLVTTVAAASLIVAHRAGVRLQQRRPGGTRMPAVLLTVLAVAWFVAALASW